MKLTIYFVAVSYIGLLTSSWVNSVIVTKLDMKTFLNYIRKEIINHNVGDIKKLFSKKDLFKYCDQLRQAKLYKVVYTTEEFSQDLPTVVYIFSKEVLELERKQTKMQLFHFRLGNSNQTFKFFGFQCMNYERNQSWIVSPTFFLDSAILFEFQLNFRHLSRRGLRGGHELIAHSVAFADVNGRNYSDNITDVLLKFKEKYNERDPLCDLNPVLKYRLCSLAVNSLDESPPPLDDLQDHNITSRVYRVEEYKQYFDRKSGNDGCETVELSFLTSLAERVSAYRKMLLCRVNEPRFLPRTEFRIGLDPFNPTRIISGFGIQGAPNRRITPFHWSIQIPLLKHLNIFEYIHFKHV